MYWPLKATSFKLASISTNLVKDNGTIIDSSSLDTDLSGYVLKSNTIEQASMDPS